MKLVLIAALLASVSLGCVVPSLTTLDNRLASIGVDPRPYPWNVDTQLYIIDKKAGSDAEGAKVWSSNPSASVMRTPDRGESTKAITSVRLPIDNQFSLAGIPAEFSKMINSALKPLGGKVSAKGEATFEVQSLDCSQRTKGGYQSLACDVEVGPQGKTLLSITNGKIDHKGWLSGMVTNHDSTEAFNVPFIIKCEEPVADAFTLTIVLPTGQQQQSVELQLNFRKALEVSGVDADAPATVVGADGTRVYLLRGNTFITRWAMPVAYGIGLVVAIQYLSEFVAKALRPKPSATPAAAVKK